MAKAFQPEASGASASESPTISLTAAATQMGMVIGTAAYMAPEQASGKVVDKRADVWAFGVVLFEMLAGTRPFVGDDVSKTLARVIDRDPDWDVLPDELPPVLASFLRGCLEKNPKRRIRDIGDVSLAMEGAFETPSRPLGDGQVAPMAYHPRSWRRAVPYVAVASLVTGLAVWALTRETPRPPVRFAVELHGSLPGNPGPVFALSADGQKLAYAAIDDDGQRLYVRSFDQLEAAPIDETEGAQNLFWSPDGQWVGFQAAGLLRKVSLAGGSPVTLCEADGLPSGVSWGSDGTIVFADYGGQSQPILRRVSAAGGIPEPITTLNGDQGEAAHMWPQVLPGNAVLFTVCYGGPFSENQIAVRSPLGEGHRVILDGTSARYVPTGHLVFAREDSLWAVPFDVDALDVTGPATPVLEDVLVTGGEVAQFSVAMDGSLVYARAGDSGEGARLVSVGRNGGEEPITPHYSGVAYPRLSPDGTQLAFRMAEGRGRLQSGNIWIWDLERSSPTKLTNEGGNEPVWTPDGASVTFGRRGDIFSRPADLSGEEEVLVANENVKFPTSWSPDGESLLYYEVGTPDPALSRRAIATGGLRDIWRLPLGGDPTPLLVTEFSESAPRVSPNGRWLAYVSDRSGQPDVYVQAYPIGGQIIPISSEGGTEPVWSRDGRELFYRDGDRMLVVQVNPDSDFSADSTDVLFTAPYARNPFGIPFGISGIPNYDVSLDGQRFVMVSSEGVEVRVILIQDWLEELKERVPVP